jgi:hypothetical protein
MASDDPAFRFRPRASPRQALPATEGLRSRSQWILAVAELLVPPTRTDFVKKRAEPSTEWTWMPLKETSGAEAARQATEGMPG